MSSFLHYLTLPYLLLGILVTLQVSALGLAGGLILGLALASMQQSRLRILSGVARTYAIIFRGTPLILQLVFAYDALPQIGLRLSAVGAAGLALAANEAPFIAEILRGGVLGVDQGQVLAGQALGMRPRVLMRRVIGPQALRLIVPALGNETVTALKNSSLASVISVQELTLRSTQLASSTFDFFSIFFASGVMYLVLTGVVSGIQLLAEDALNLDRSSRRSLLTRLLPGRRRVTVLPALPAAGDTARAAAPGPADPVARLPTGWAARRMAGGPAKSLHPRTGETVVDVQGLRKQYGDHVVLDRLDLSVQSGEVVAMLGRSGSGKSTLLRAINHLEAVDGGSILVQGRNIGYRSDGSPLPASRVATERAAAGVGMVFQHFNLFAHLSAQENIAGPLRWVHQLSARDADARASQLLDRVGLAHRAHALPRHLSGGQQQRVAIGRALAPNPKLLLLDEPTSALDPEFVTEVLDVIGQLAYDDGLTMIIATHQLRFAREVADRVVFLADGKVVEDGPAEQVLHRPEHPTTARFLNVVAGEHFARTGA
jgi:polar amino acid transport system permease protein